MNTKILEKIKKLLSLSESSNPNEANLAMAKAYELMATYNIELQSVNDHETDYGTIAQEYKRYTTEDKFIFTILAKYFQIKIFMYRKQSIEFSGTPTNVLIAYDLHIYLNDTFKQSWLKYKRLEKVPVSYKQSFYHGMQEGIISNLKAKKEEMQEKRLILLKDNQLEEYYKKKYPKLKPIKSQYNLVSNNARSQGYTQGKSIQLHKGIN